jgi:hypothetical protein
LSRADEQSLDDLLEAAGFSRFASPPHSVPAAHGAPVAILSGNRERCGVSCTIDARRELADLLAGDLDMLTHHEPGDTALDIGDATMTVHRLLVEPTPGDLRDAAAHVQRCAALLKRILAMAADTLMLPPEPEVPEPAFPDYSALIAELENLMAVVVCQYEQGAWEKPDPTGPEIRRLPAGTTCHLIRREGDWARVMLEDKSVVFTDGRTLLVQGGS